jgi:hypothetical protein
MGRSTMLRGIVLKKARDGSYIVRAYRDARYIREVELVNPKLTGSFVPDGELLINQAPFGRSRKCSISLERFDVWGR